MKFLGMIQDRLKSISHTWIRFPMVFILLCSIAVYASISISTDSDHLKEIYALIIGVFLSASMTFTFEKRQKPVMWLVISQTVVLAVTAAYYFLVLGSYSGSVKDSARVVILCFALLFVGLSVPCLRWKTDFNDFFMTFFKAFFTTVFFIAIIWGGISLVLSAVDTLLFSLDENVFIYVAVWIWIFFAPMLLLSLIPVFSGTQEDKDKEEHLAKIPGFFRALLSYVLIPLTALYTLVLLAYLVKTFVGGDPGDLLRPLILAYCIDVIILYILVSKIDIKIATLFRMIAPKLMLLIALYQVINLIIKIPGEGIVYGRYFVILFGIFSVAAGVLMSVLPVRKNVVIAIVLVGFALISVTPPVDAFTTGTNSQLGILDRVLTANNMIKDGAIIPNKGLAEVDQGLIRDAMQYLYDVKETDKVPGISDKFELYSDFENTFGFSYYYETVNADTQEPSYWYSIDTASPIDISEYDYMVTTYGSSYGGKTSGEVTASVTDKGTKYDVAVVPKGGEILMEIRDPSGSVLASASIGKLIDSITENESASQNEQLSPDMLTFDVKGTGVDMRIIFQNASKQYNGTEIYYDANMSVLLRFE